MNSSQTDAPDAAAPALPGQTLRQRAQARWQAIRQAAPDPAADLTVAASHTLLHELQVHQIELMMQNEELRQAKDALDASRARYVDLYDLAPVGYCSVNEAGMLVQSNLTLAGMLGLTRADLQRQPRLTNYVLPADQDTWYHMRARLLATGEPQSGEIRLHLGQGQGQGEDPHLWVHLIANLAIDDTGQRLLHIAVSDISARKQAQGQLELAASVFSHAREAIIITDADGTIVDVNAAFVRITGYGRDEAIGQNQRFLSANWQDTADEATIQGALSRQDHWSGELWNRHKNGTVYAVQLTISVVRDQQGHTQQCVLLFSDITAAKQHKSELEHIAHFDALTNLPNRALLADRLQQAMAQTLRRKQQLAVAYLDLDNFKAINDHYGHDVGDQVLIALTHRMSEVLRQGDTLARIGGDEFVAVLIDLEDSSDQVQLLNRLLAAAAQPVQVGELSLKISASLGVTFYPQPRDIAPDQLLRQADQAMYQAKVAGKNRNQVFDTAQDTELRNLHDTIERMRQALQHGEFVLHYQPKVNLRGGEVIGAEALIRWDHPEKGQLPPAAFLPAIEGHPLAVALGEWVIGTALAQIGQWRAQGLDLAVSVNVGARQLQQTDFVQRLRGLLASHPEIEPSQLELEILETSALADIAQVSQIIDECAHMGIMFALDDFGTGYSSLTYLKRLRVKLLKIDRSFVHDMPNDPDDQAILHSVIGLATALNREVIAEGVETAAHCDLLLQLGCDLAQGYGIARPMPAEHMPSWVASWRRDHAAPVLA